MTPGARIASVIELLDAIDSDAMPPDQIIDQYFRKRRYAGSGDRRYIGGHVYDILRHRARLDWWLERTGLALSPDARSRALVFLIVQDRASPDDINNIFSGNTHCPPPLDDDEIALVDGLYGRPAINEDMPDHVRLEYPEWMDRSFRSMWGDALEAEMSALNQPASMDLRVNTMRVKPEDALARLREDYTDCEPTPLSPLGIRVDGKLRIGGTRAYKEGLVEVQDEGSQLVSILVDARPGMTVVDYCAGAGGKTLAMAAMMAQGGRISGRLHALDVSGYRLERMAPRQKRAGIHGIKRRAIAAENDPWIAENVGTADRVLCDVPCTQTGSWRRNPESRWRFSPQNLDDIRELQQRILTSAATLVNPGGRLVYVTCSLLQEENEQQLFWFLENHSDFQPMSIDQVWRETVGGPPPPTGPSLRLSPASTGTDGFFCAVFERG